MALPSLKVLAEVNWVIVEVVTPPTTVPKTAKFWGSREAELSAKLMKNSSEPLLGLLPRAMAMVPAVLVSPAASV